MSSQATDARHLPTGTYDPSLTADALSFKITIGEALRRIRPLRFSDDLGDPTVHRWTLLVVEPCAPCAGRSGSCRGEHGGTHGGSEGSRGAPAWLHDLLATGPTAHARPEAAH